MKRFGATRMTGHRVEQQKPANCSLYTTLIAKNTHFITPVQTTASGRSQPFAEDRSPPPQGHDHRRRPGISDQIRLPTCSPSPRDAGFFSWCRLMPMTFLAWGRTVYPVHGRAVLAGCGPLAETAFDPMQTYWYRVSLFASSVAPLMR
jgi:hypothetical protein